MMERSCGALVYYREQNKEYYLLVQNRNGGHWSFAKGHIEKKETEEETAKREIFEETGLEIQNFNPSFRQVTSYNLPNGKQKFVTYFLTEIDKEKATHVKLQEEEILDHLFLPYNEASQQLTYDNDRQVLKLAHQALIF